MRSGTPKTNDDVAVIPLTCFVDGRGSLTPIERKEVPFDIARVYFIHGMDEETTRGNHGHYRTNQVLIAVEGDVIIDCYDGTTRRKHVLDTSEKGLYVPAGIWTTNHHNKGSVMCVLADRPYSLRDCIEDRSIFKRWKRRQPFFGVFDSFGELEADDSLENGEWLDYQLGELGRTEEPDQELKNLLTDGMVVVDFGGSLGHSYLKLTNSGQFANVEYHVVETPLMVNAGRRLFPDHQRLFFHEQIPELPVVDVVYSRTALQYVEDWRGVLEQLASLDADYMVLSDTQVGNNSTFVGIQNWYGHFVPNWFFDIDVLIDALSSSYDVYTISKGMSVNMGNYPKEQRLTHACNLVFRRLGS